MPIRYNKATKKYEVRVLSEVVGRFHSEGAAKAYEATARKRAMEAAVYQRGAGAQCPQQSVVGVGARSGVRDGLHNAEVKKT